MIAITLFDTFHIEMDGMPTRLPYRQAEAVLIYLLVAHPEPVSKEVIAELIWPERPPGTARANLRHAIHTLRGQPGLSEVVASDRNLVFLRGLDRISCDYLSFRERVSQEGAGNGADADAVRAVIRLYGSGLLETFDAEPSREYGFWLYTARRTCAGQLYSFLFNAVPGLCAGGGEPFLHELADFLILREPYDTSLYEFLLRSLVSRGNSRFAGFIHRGVSETAEKGEDEETVNALSDVARRIFPRDNFPIKRRLPPQLLPFVGRKVELAKITEVIDRAEVRLLTITAPGGYGKTSLSLALARSAEEALFPDGIYFISFGDAPDEGGIVRRLLSCFGLAFANGTLEDLLGYLADKRLLVIFDELENAPYASVFIERLLRGSASVKILATSRRELGLNLEWVYHLSPLVRGEDARELFFRTAERKTGKRSWTDEEAALVDDICVAVDMIPLAIELAASRTGAADKKTLDDLLRDLRGDSLAGASAGARSRGMEAAGMADIFRLMEYQIGLLDEPARRDFYPLSLFRETFDFEAARGAFGVSSEAFAEYRRLSLVWPSGDGLYRIHGQLRSFCLSALRKAGEYANAERRLFEYMGELSRLHFLRLFSLREDPLAVVERYGGEIEAAWFHALGNRDWDLVVRIAVPLGSFLHYHGQERKGRELFRNELDRLLGEDAAQDATAPGRCHAVLQIALICAVLALQAEDMEYGRGLLQAMTEIDERSGKGFLAGPVGNPDERGESSPDLDPYRLYLRISFPWVRGIYARAAGESGRARELFIESRLGAVRCQAHLCRVYIEIHLAMVEFETDPGAAVRLLEEALESNHGKCLSGIRSDIFLLLARFSLALGKMTEAAGYAETVLREPMSRPSSRTEMEAFFILALISVNKETDREIPVMYLLRALDAARKNGLLASAVDSALDFIRRWLSVFGVMPSWEIYERIAVLFAGAPLKRKKEELDRLYGLG